MLDLESRRVVMLLIPLLRLAMALDQSQDQRVERVVTFLRERSVELELHSGKDTDVEEWHAKIAGEVFQEIYGRPLEVRKAQ
jgi:hypothetical protein